MSLQRRVVLGVIAVIVVLVTSNLLLAVSFERHLMGRVDEQLTDTIARPLLTRRAQGSGGPAELEPLTDLFIGVADPTTGTIVQIGAPLRDAQPPAIEPDDLTARATRAGTPLEPFIVHSSDGDDRWRVAAVGGLADGSRLLVLGVNLADVDAAMARARSIQVIGSIAVVAALGAMAWWVLRLGVRPLVALTKTADEIAAGDLSKRADLIDDRTEAGRLGHAFNTMVGEIEESMQRRAESEERVRRFAADASHELRTPLTSIRGYAELWEAGGLRDPDQLADAMRRLTAESQRMSALVDDLMMLARLDQARELDRADVRLDELVADAVQDARTIDPDRPIDTDLEPAVVTGDEHSLRQVVANLLANALHHTPPRTPVHVQLRAVDGMARLDVRDEGPGVPHAVADHLFERFFRADASRVRDGRGGGSGLGLAIVHSVVEAHDGTASIATAPGEGFAVTVELPLSST